MKSFLFTSHIQEMLSWCMDFTIVFQIGDPLEICLSKSIFLSGLEMTGYSTAQILISVAHLYISLANLL